MDFQENLESETAAFANDLVQGDDLGVVIRVHIRIENALREVVRSLIKEPGYLDKMDLDYSNVVLLAVALGVNKAYAPSLNAIGTLRNKFAHNLNTKLDSNTISSLYAALASDHKEETQRMSKKLWIAHKGSSPYPQFKNLQPRDQFISIAVILWGAAIGAVFHLKERSREA